VRRDDHGTHAWFVFFGYGSIRISNLTTVRAYYLCVSRLALAKTDLTDQGGVRRLFFLVENSERNSWNVNDPESMRCFFFFL